MNSPLTSKPPRGAGARRPPKTVPVPKNERDRLAALRSYDILDTPPEEIFDRITHLVAAYLRAPIALISLVDENRQWFKSCYGLNVRETPRDIAFCAHTIADDDVLVVNDATKDARFNKNPLVTKEPHIRFYAGAPLRNREGFNLGTLCAIDYRPRQFTDEQAQVLADLAHLVVNEMELKIAGKTLLEEIAERQRVEKELSRARDELELRIAERTRELRQSEERFRDFASTSSDYFFEMDENLRFSYFSDRFTEIAGISPDKLLGKTRQETGIPGVDQESWRRHLADLAARRPFRNFVHPRTHPDGSVVYLSINGNPVFDADSRFLGYRCTGADITATVKADEERRLAQQQAEQANLAKSEFMASMSHDLRTPLNAILGFSQLLCQQYLGPIGKKKYGEYADNIHASAEHLLALVNDILDLSTIEAGKQSLTKEKFDVGEAVSDCARIVAEEARSRGIELVTKAPKSLPRLYADRRAVKKILLNLLSNALKFTPAGGRITVAATATKRKTVFKIADTGKGIPAKRLREITDPFGGAEYDPYVTGEGWGLGLTITKSLIDVHGGTLEINSKVGKGTTVTVTLPNGKS